MAAANFYLGLVRGANNNPFAVTAGNASAGTAVDVEVRMQTNNGAVATGLTRKDVNLLLDTIRAFINSSGLNEAGANLPN
jgi:hypothetical protein